MNCITIRVSGDVYKTGYRYYTKQIAGLLLIKGTVRYMKDRSILIEAMGEKKQLDDFCNFCRMGNVSSKILEFDVEHIGSKSFENFEIINN